MSEEDQQDQVTTRLTLNLLQIIRLKLIIRPKDILSPDLLLFCLNLFLVIFSLFFIIIFLSVHLRPSVDGVYLM